MFIFLTVCCLFSCFYFNFRNCIMSRLYHTGGSLRVASWKSRQRVQIGFSIDLMHQVLPHFFKPSLLASTVPSSPHCQRGVTRRLSPSTCWGNDRHTRWCSVSSIHPHQREAHDTHRPDYLGVRCWFDDEPIGCIWGRCDWACMRIVGWICEYSMVEEVVRGPP